jgi:hypothetical protein
MKFEQAIEITATRIDDSRLDVTRSGRCFSTTW